MTRSFWPFRTRAVLAAQRDRAEARTSAVQLRLARLKTDRDKADAMSGDLLFERNRLLGERATLQNEVTDRENEIELLKEALQEAREQRDDARDQRDDARDEARRRGARIEKLSAELEAARSGDGELTVLLYDGSAISGHRSKADAREFAQRTYGVNSSGWSPSEGGQRVTSGWAMSTIPLIGEQPKAVTA